MSGLDLIERLRDGLTDYQVPLHPAVQVELGTRLVTYDRNRAGALPWKEVEAHLLRGSPGPPPDWLARFTSCVKTRRLPSGLRNFLRAAAPGHRTRQLVKAIVKVRGHVDDLAGAPVLARVLLPSAYLLQQVGP